MTYCWKTEYVVVDNNGNDYAWHDDPNEAIAHAMLGRGHKVVEQRHYLTERDDFWEAE